MSHNILNGGIGYEGKVTLTLKSNNRVLESRTYKNKGTARLFRFLGYCLAGAYTEVEDLLPNKIALLHNPASSTASANETSAVPVTTLIGYAQTPSITSEAAEVKVTYSFEIPKSRINDNFNQVALYGAGKTDPDTEFSAYYYLTDGSGTEIVTQEISKWSATTVLLIDWELSLSNKNTEVANN